MSDTIPIPTPRVEAEMKRTVLWNSEKRSNTMIRLARALERELAVAEEALRKVAADSEAETGWGPDVTTLSYIKQALRRLAEMRAQKGSE